MQLSCLVILVDNAAIFPVKTLQLIMVRGSRHALLCHLVTRCRFWRRLSIEELLESSTITGSSPIPTCVPTVASAAWFAEPSASEAVGTTTLGETEESLPRASVLIVVEGNMFDLDESGRKLPWRTEAITSSSFLIGDVSVSLAYVAAVCRPFMLCPPRMCRSYSLTPALLAQDNIVAFRPCDVKPGCRSGTNRSNSPLTHAVTSLADGYRCVSCPEASGHSSRGPETTEKSTPFVEAALTKALPQLSPHKPYTGIKTM